MCLTYVRKKAVRNCAVAATRCTPQPVRRLELNWDPGGSSWAVVRFLHLQIHRSGASNAGKIRVFHPNIIPVGNLTLCVCIIALTCGANSTYSSCMTSCPSSCADLAAPSECEIASCVEGCKCANGFVMSEGTCVPYPQCGCTFLNRYYPVSCPHLHHPPRLAGFVHLCGNLPYLSSLHPAAEGEVCNRRLFPVV